MSSQERGFHDVTEEQIDSIVLKHRAQPRYVRRIARLAEAPSAGALGPTDSWWEVSDDGQTFRIPTAAERVQLGLNDDGTISYV